MIFIRFSFYLAYFLSFNLVYC